MGMVKRSLNILFMFKLLITDWLVVKKTILKNMKVNGKDYPIYYGKKNMFETTTNQLRMHCS